MCFVGWVFAAAAILRANPPIDLVDDREWSPSIQWKSSWEQTLDTNLTAWRQGLGKDMDPRQVERVLAVRELALRRAMRQRFAAERAQRLDSLEREAELWRQLGRDEEAARTLEQLIAESPGDGERAADALATIARTASKGPEATQRREWALRRLLALARLGLIPSDDSRLQQVVTELIDQSIAAGSLAVGWQQLEKMPQTTDANRAARWLAESDLLWASGDGAAAIAAIDRALDLLPDNDRLASRAADRRRLLDKLYVPAPMPLYPLATTLGPRIDAIAGDAGQRGPATLDALFAATMHETGLVRVDPDRHASGWRVLDELVRRQGAETLAELRAEQNRLAAAGGEATTATSPHASDAQLMAIFRRFPWSIAASEAMLQLGERMLWRGQTQLASRCFIDAWQRSADPGLQARALAGALLCGGSNPSAMRTLLHEAPDDQPLPWRGRTAALREIRRELAERPGPAPGSPPRATAPLVLRTPTGAFWPQGFLDTLPSHVVKALPLRPSIGQEPASGMTIVASPGLLAGYRPGEVEPTWTVQAPAPGRAESDSRLVVTGPFEPALADGRLVTRWGLDREGRYLAHVAAFDASDGSLQWSTQQDETWARLWPINDPTLVEGRAYLLAVEYEQGRRPLLAPVHLLCLDAASGRMIWRQLITTQSMDLIVDRRVSSLGMNQVDLVHYGNAVAVHDGSVFCSTNLGVVASADARDGLVQWTRHDPRLTINAANWPQVVARHGATPIVDETTVVVMPRDLPGMMGLDRATGQRLWHNPLAPNRAVIGRFDDLILAHDGACVGAVRVADGSLVWLQRFDPLDASPKLAGDRVVVSSGGVLQTLGARTGLADSSTTNAGVVVRAMAMIGERPVILTDEQPGLLSAADIDVRKAPRGAGSWPAWPLARIDADGARVVLPPEATADPARFVLRTSELLQMFDARSPAKPRWHVRYDRSLKTILWTQRTLLLIFPDRVQVLEIDSGNVVAISPLDRPAATATIQLGRLLLRDGSWMAAVDPATGRPLWQRDFRDIDGFRLDQVTDDGRDLLLLGEYGRRQWMVLRVDPATGRVARRITHFDPPRDTLRLAIAPQHVLWVASDGRLHRAALEDGRVEAFKVRANVNFRSRLTMLDVFGPWVRLRRYQGGSTRDNFSQWWYRLDDPTFASTAGGDGTLEGDRLVVQDRNSLTITDLRSGAKVAYALPGPQDQRRYTRPLAWRRQLDSFTVVSAMGDHRPNKLPRVRVDAFDAAGGQPVAGTILNGVGYDADTAVAWRGDLLVVADPTGLHLLAPGDPPPFEPLPIAAGRPDEFVDGEVASWPADTRQSLDEAAAGSRLNLAREDRTLYVSLVTPQRRPQPLIGRGAVAAGDRLDVAMTGNSGSMQLQIGCSRDGRTIVHAIIHERAVESVRAAVRYDPIAGEMIYELALPIHHVVNSNSPDAHLLGLTLEARSGDSDDAPLARLGRGITGRGIELSGQKLLLIR